MWWCMIFLPLCVLTGLWTGKYDRIMRWWSSKPHSGIAAVLDSSTYCYVFIPFRPCCSSTHCSYHTRSSSHLGVTRLRTSIPDYQTRLSAHPGIYCLCPSIPTSNSETPPPSGSYFMDLSPNSLLVLASCETPVKVARSCFYVASWRQKDSLLHPPPLYP